MFTYITAIHPSEMALFDKQAAGKNLPLVKKWRGLQCGSTLTPVEVHLLESVDHVGSCKPFFTFDWNLSLLFSPSPSPSLLLTDGRCKKESCKKDDSEWTQLSFVPPQIIALRNAYHVYFSITSLAEIQRKKKTMCKSDWQGCWWEWWRWWRWWQWWWWRW